MINRRRREEVINHRAVPAKCSGSDLTTPSRPIDLGREVDAHTRGQPPRVVPKTTTNAGKALCRTRTDDPFLTMEVLYQLS